MRKEPGGHDGFTIIEVVLVLAIAGLIFLIVFMAVPALQRSQRDQQRKSDVGQVRALVEEWRANHRGQYIEDDTDLQSFATTAFANRQDPSGTPYSFVFLCTTCDHALAGTGPLAEITFMVGHVCERDGSNNYVEVPPSGWHDRKYYSVLTRLEGGDPICIDNR